MPSYHTTRFNKLKYNLVDSECEVHDFKTVSSCVAIKSL